MAHTQPRAYVHQRIEILSIDPDGLNAFRRKIVVLSWISRQGNWMKSKTLGRFNVEWTTSPMTFDQDECSS
ncbi:hypothetical protein X766_33925 [Mesorhizobium sp. LSJC255A00]|nr:hypothetical protein X766_33925 [Mesorhizobium sp. LSJC255A00]